MLLLLLLYTPNTRYTRDLYRMYALCVHRPGPGEPVRWRVHQRPAVAQPHTPEDRRDGRGRRPAVRHI